MNDIKKGTLAVISGFSGAGKGTVTRRLLDKYADECCLSISVTTRSPREGEKDGIHYFFRTKEQFEQMIKEDRFLEHACYVDNYYGTPREFVEEKRKAGIHVILEIEIQGALQVKKRYPEAVLIFVTPPSARELEKRLRGRGTESEEEIADRLAKACEEARDISSYDHIVINDTVEECVDRVYGIIRGVSDRVANNEELIRKITEELRVFKKGE